MASVVGRVRTETSLDSNPRLGPQKPTVLLRVFNIMVGVMFFHLPDGFITQANGVQGAPFGTSGGSPAGGVRPWVTREGLRMPCVHFSPLMPFFWVVNASLAAWRIGDRLPWMWPQRRCGQN